MKVNLVIGGGVVGLYSAHVLQKRFPETPVVVLEASPDIGGLLKSKYYGRHGAFDYGIHTFYETGIEEIDSYFLELPIDWKFLTGYERDLGGAAWDGAVNYQAPYLDLCSMSDHAQCRKGIDAVLSAPPSDANDLNLNADQWLNKRFGGYIADHYMAKAVEAKQHQPVEDVHWLAARVQGLNRVVVDEEETVLANYKNGEYSSRIAFPDQYTYPKDIIPNKRSYYPSDVGIGRSMDAIASDLQKRGVRILTSAKATQASTANGKVDAVSVTLGDGEQEAFETNRVVCAVPLPAFLFTLEQKPQPQPFAKPHQTVICNLLSSAQPKDEGLYYIYFHGHPRIHRVSFPYNYSNEDPERRGYAMSVECVYPQGEDASDAAAMVIGALVDYGVIASAEGITFSDSFVSAGGYPNMSVGNINALSFYREFMATENIRNFDNVGILAREDLFFQFDLIKHANEILV